MKSVAGGYPLLHQGTNGTGAGGIGTDRGTGTGTCTGTSTGTGTPKLEMVSGHPPSPVCYQSSI